MLETRILLELLAIFFVSTASSDAKTVNNLRPPRCEKGEYFKISDAKCKPCSSCPPNHILRMDCSRYKDSVCVPFYITQFNVGTNVHEENKDKSVEDAREESDIVSCEKDHNEVLLQESAMKFWMKLSYSLIGLTCLLVFIIIFLFVQFIICQKHISHKTMDHTHRRARVFSRDRVNTNDNLADPCLPETLESLRRARAFSRDRLNGNDYQSASCLSPPDTLESLMLSEEGRVLIGADGHQYIDEVFSRDAASGISQTPGTAHRLQPPIYVPNISASKPASVSWTPHGMIVMDNMSIKSSRKPNRV